MSLFGSSRVRGVVTIHTLVGSDEVRERRRQSAVIGAKVHLTR